MYKPNKTLSWLIILMFITSIAPMQRHLSYEEGEEEISCCNPVIRFCASYTSCVLTFHGIQYLLPDEVAFPLAIGCITGIATWNIGKGCSQMTKDTLKNYQFKEKVN